MTKLGDLRAPYVLNSFTGSDLNAVPFARTDLNWSKFTDFNETSLIFNDGSNIPPSDGALVQSEVFIDYSSTSGIILMLFAVVGIFSTLFTLRVILVNRSKSSLRHSSPQHLAVILLGIIGLYCNAFLYLGQIRDCFMTLWIPVLSYSCIVGTINVLIFSGQKDQAKFLKDSIYIRYLIIVLWFEIVLLAVWTKLSSVQSLKIELAPDSYAFACQFSTRMDWPYALIALFNIILGLFALVISGLIWNVEATYNESSEMLWTVIAMVFYVLASFALDKGADFGRKLIFKAGASYN
ncbi:hypothetical protein BCR33DRAFT_36405 [Rhizoclosmatium globosum]|uniref:G-protein coupled receptors family 3 profile domain-containing protein n=1 Tax=Rhizoclosmatium globosum TaxID=329046 RepID=A0A1Y2CNG2_9FUNG|nr:hypothetical protein BCR33DRAFT_36405 [Rhizoclosmatium globosum]|eukprot:ORY48486.1 hypothetical protein BCR33DRAFT_36405 [Rhizoclosmatium globosum]